MSEQLHLKPKPREGKPSWAAKRRKRVFLKYKGRCIYCERLTILGKTSRDGFDALMLAQARNEVAREWGFKDYASAPRQSKRDMLASCEHLVRRVDGGTWSEENIALACTRCNSDRQEASVEEHKKAMREKYGQKVEPL